MPGDPTEARVHAANCTKLAETASSPTLQQTFLDLAKQWTRLANELDDAYALLKALNELDLRPRPPVLTKVIFQPPCRWIGQAQVQ